MSRSHVPTWLRRRLTDQAGDRCGYCLTPSAVTGAPLVIDHLIPKAFGGATEDANLWLACSQCNLHKGDRISARDPVTSEWVPLFNPRYQRWHEHFRWTETGDEVFGLTEVGRATVVALALNRPLLVRARTVAIAAEGVVPLLVGAEDEDVGRGSVRHRGAVLHMVQSSGGVQIGRYVSLPGDDHVRGICTKAWQASCTCWRPVPYETVP
jgi:hypothetical protein